MSRKPYKPRGIVLPAMVALLCALGLLAYSHAGGDEQLQDLLDALASNQQFVSRTLSIETGVFAVSESTASATVSPFAQVVSSTTADATSSTTTDNIAPVSISIENAFQSSIVLQDSVEKVLNELKIGNESGISVDASAMLSDPIDLKISGEGAQVVIYHTHTTEAYTPSGTDTYEALSETRTLDSTQSVVRVGQELVQVLESYGIEVIHLTDVYDYPSYDGAYAASQAALEQVVADNPSVCVTIDLHRDAVYNEDGTPYDTTVTVDGQEIAPMMLVVGTNASGLTHDNWLDNFNFACNLQNDMMNTAPDLMRSLNLRRQRFNQHVTTGSLLLEVGWAGNTLQQALASVRIFGEVLAQAITESDT